MKKTIVLSVASIALLLAAVSCKQEAQRVTALVAPCGDVLAAVVEYPDALDPTTITPETYAVEGREVACVKVLPFDPTAGPKDGCKEGKPKCDKQKACDKEKSECEKPCDKAEGKCDKPCDKAKAECCKKGKPECDQHKAECDHKGHKCDKGGKYVVVLFKHQHGGCEDGQKSPAVQTPSVSLQQVVEVKTAEGKAIKAWAKPIESTITCAAGGHHHDAPKGEDCKKSCEQASAE